MKKSGKRIWIVSGFLLTGLLIWVLLPSNYYLRQAVRFLYPKIDDHVYFENRTVKAGDPEPWPFDPRFGQLSVDSVYRPVFDDLGTVAYLVVRDGKILYEEYGPGYDEWRVSNSFSMAKSLVSLLVGCAIEDGYIQSVDDPVNRYLPEYPVYQGVETTIKDLLTMSAGLDWDESDAGPFSWNARIYYGNDLPGLMKQLKPNRKPGTEFEYQSGVTQVLAAVLEKQTGRPISEYASEKIWTPIHAEQDALWTLDHKDGMEKAYCCYNAVARDFARLGQLVLDSGRWQGHTIVPQEYVKQAIQPDTTLYSVWTKSPNRFYGYQFWYLKYRGMDVPYMRGVLGQYVLIVPEKRAVIVRLGKKRSKEYCQEQYYPLDIDTWLDCAFNLIDRAEKESDPDR